MAQGVVQQQKLLCFLCLSLVTLLAHGEQAPPGSSHAMVEQKASAVSPQVFAPGVISGPANDGSPSFSSDGNELFFTRTTAHWSAILESHRAGGQWSHPTLAAFSGEWPESSPALSPDGSYVVFQSTRPAAQGKPGEPAPRPVSNLWRVDRNGSGWNKPVRLPDAVNIGHSIWRPSIAADHTLYFTVIDEKGNKRLFSSGYAQGSYQQAQPLSFSDGTTADVDPEIAPDGHFLVFCSSGRVAGDTKDHLFIVPRTGAGWGAVKQIDYAPGEKADEASTDDDPRLGADHRTLYFSSDRAVPVHFPRTAAQAREDLERLESWDNSNTNVWFIPLGSWL